MRGLGSNPAISFAPQSEMEEFCSFVGVDRDIEGAISLAGKALHVIFNKIYKIKRKTL